MSNRDNRITFLEKSLEENPTDPFFQYALSMEYENRDLEKAISLLKQLQKTQPDYLPTYLTLGRWLHDEAESNQAIEILEIGKKLSQKQGDSKPLEKSLP